MKKVMNLFDKVDSVIFFVAQIAVFIMMILISADAFMRYVFNQSIVGAYQFSEKYLMVILVFLSISYVWKLGGHIRIDLLTQFMPNKLVKVLDILYTLAAACLIFLIGYQAMISTQEAYINNYVAAGLIPWPTWLSWVWVLIGPYIFTIRLLLSVVYMLLTFNQEDSEAFGFHSSSSED
ncbi:TRAP transporter small permease [Peribacillus aracenensis]|uniref:TRAP transporter small permease n=1 Tax=Peribacillus aracenensis TaxID=2976708 RepID=UPI0021A8AD9F|nr:TRAP transporter small permease [Peribacillus sp. BBB004]